MHIFKTTIKNTQNIDNKNIALLNRITGQSLSIVKESISNGKPFYSVNLSFSEFYGKDTVVEKLIKIFQENNIDVIIEYGRKDRGKHGLKKYSLTEFINFRNEAEKRIDESNKEWSEIKNDQDAFDKYIEEKGWRFSIERVIALIYKKGNYDRAIYDCNKLMELYPDSENYYCFYFYRGEAYKRKGEYDCALADYNKALELNPESNEILEEKKNLEKKIEIEKKQIINFNEKSKNIKKEYDNEY